MYLDLKYEILKNKTASCIRNFATCKLIFCIKSFLEHINRNIDSNDLKDAYVKN